MTAPHARLFSFDLGFDTTPWEPEGSGRLSPHLFAPGTDVVLLSVLMTIADNSVGSAIGMARRPDISFTTNLSGGLVARPPVDAYRTGSAVLHDGNALAMGETSFRAGGSEFASVQGSFVRSPNPAHRQPEDQDFVRPEAGMLDRPLFEHCGITVKEPGEAVVDLLPDLQNGSGLLHGGAHVVLAECAALSADPSPGRVTLDMSVSYLRGAKAGPVRAVATGSGGTSGVWRYRVELRDVGAGDRICSLSTVTVINADLLK